MKKNFLQLMGKELGLTGETNTKRAFAQSIGEPKADNSNAASVKPIEEKPQPVTSTQPVASAAPAASLAEVKNSGAVQKVFHNRPPIATVMSAAKPPLPAGKTDLPKGTDPTLTVFLKYFDDALVLEKNRAMRADLQISNADDRKIFKSVSWEDSVRFHNVLLIIYSMCFQIDFNDLDENDPYSIEYLNEWNTKNQLQFPITADNLNKRLERNTPKALRMVKTAVNTLNKVEAVDAFIARHAGNVYTTGFDMEKKEFQEPWVKTVLDKAISIGRADFKANNGMPDDKEGKDVVKYYGHMKAQNDIIHRPFLSQAVIEEFKSEFKPVLEAMIAYFHTHSVKNRIVNQYHGEALDIWDALYEKKNDAPKGPDAGKKEEEPKQPEVKATAPVTAKEVAPQQPASPEINNAVKDAKVFELTPGTNLSIESDWSDLVGKAGDSNDRMALKANLWQQKAEKYGTDDMPAEFKDLESKDDMLRQTVTVVHEMPASNAKEKFA